MEQNRNSIFTKSDEELIRILARWWKMSEDELLKPFKVIASFKKSEKKDKNNRTYGFFIDVRNLNGDILYYPLPKEYGRVSIFSMCKEKFMSSEFLQINVKLASRSQREKHDNPFMLTMDNWEIDTPNIHFIDRIKKEKLIRHRFEQTGYTEIDAINTSNALVRLMGDLYTETERFVFELLQNADDQPEEGELVNVKLKALDENLLFLHTGKPFNEADVESISSIGDSTKKNDIEKTGYKGIGFKSVFSVAETVYIDSGNFSFAFDKNSPLYPDEADMDKIPWQIKPIWEERYRLPKEVQKEDLFFYAPVGIALNVGCENIGTYIRSISELLVNPQFTLFLRNVGEISFESKGRDTIKINKQVTESGIVEITSNSITENWITKDYIIDIPVETRDAIQNEKLVPAKLKEATKTKISFAVKIEDGTICPVDDAVLYTYLPTKVNDFGFKFLVNADFLTTASREQIHSKNIWNRFLFAQVGKLLLDWIKSLKDYKGALSLLPSHIDDTDNLLANDFYKALTQSISSISFIKGHKENMLVIKNIMLDKSGLSHIIGKDLFCDIVNPEKSLPFDVKDEETLKESSLFEDIEVIKTLPVLEKIKLSVPFHKWFLAASEELKKAFYDWLININTEKRKPAILALVDNLPIYKFGESYNYKKWVEEDTNKFVIRSPHAALKPIFESCGYECSNNIDESPIASFYSKNVIQSTFSYIFGHLTSRDSFSRWLSTSSNEELKILIDWLVFQDKTNHKTVSEFVEALPIVKFDDVSMTKQSANQDATRIIIIDKIESIKPILTKMGFKCSQNLEASSFVSLISLPKEIDLFNRIKEKTSDTPLSPEEKVELFKTLKQLTGVTDVLLSQILLFSNHTNTHRKWLSIMTGYSADLPAWMHNYCINEKENFEELQPYLVKKERIFEDIVKPNIDEIVKNVTLKELYLTYINPWTLEFTKTIINKYGVTLPVLDMVEEQNSDSKKYLLQKIGKVELNLEEVYDCSSPIYRVLAMAIQALDDDDLRSFASNIWIGERTLSSFMVSDEISFDYHEGKLVRFPLIKLLPSYADTGIVQKIKNTLSNFDVASLNKLLALKPMSTQEVWQKVDRTNDLTPYAYLLGIYRTRKVHNYYNSYVPYVDLTPKTDAWISELLSIMYEQKIELYQDCFGYRLSSYFTGYISNDYVNEDETILKSIEKWADTDDKLTYIVGLGVKTERTNLVKCRKSLVNNEPLNSSEIESIKENISSTINLLKSKMLLPLQGSNQIAVMLALEAYSKYLVVFIDKDKLSANSVEYTLPEYENWKQASSITVFLYDGQMPYQLKKTNDNDLLICSFDRDDYYYDNGTRTLYVNKLCEVRDTLYSLVSDKSIPFSSEDWQQLYYDNLVSKSEVESREQEIEVLKSELEEYKRRYGTLPPKTEDTKKDEEKKDSKNSEDEPNKDDSKSDNDKESKKDEDPTIKKGNNSQIPKSKQYEAQIEAQKFLMQEEPSWHFPPHYGEYKEDYTPYYYSTVELEDADGNPLLIVLKSYKKQDEPFKVNPEELDYIFKDSADLLIYTGDDIKRIEKEDLVRNQSSISLSFSTENLDIEERIDAFCSTLHYFKELHFDFSSFNIAENAESIRTIYNRNKGTQNSDYQTEEDI